MIVNVGNSLTFEEAKKGGLFHGFTKHAKKGSLG